MAISRDYLLEIQKFTTSHYWNSGVRITTGVIVPMLIMLNMGWLSQGIPFLFGALFVSLTDSPGPIHHRRNGMFTSVALNTAAVLLMSLLHEHQVLLISVVLVLSFCLSMFGIYGARAQAIGTLTIVIMLIHMSPLRHDPFFGINALLTFTGGLWYAALSLTLYRLQPYRLVDQALGEHLMLIAGYLRARAAFYREHDANAVFNRVMTEQVAVLKAQGTMRELLFKTRQLVGDASPKSRSIMMIFLESLDLFEETMYSYQDYKVLHEHINEDLMRRFYLVILRVVAEFELIGLSVQSGSPVKKMPSFSEALGELDYGIREREQSSSSAREAESLQALRLTLNNLRGIVNRLSKVVQYTRMEAHDPERFPDQDIEKPASSPRITLSLFKENLTFRSNTFRFAVRITVALLVGYIVSTLFTLSHAYWVMLTIVTILKPVYNLTRSRNIQRVLGTLVGVLLGSGIIFTIQNTVALVSVMIVCMVIGYSLLRKNYFGFVSFLTIYIIITFHFLNPIQFRDLIGERLTDTLIGSVIAAIASRFIFPVWQHLQIQTAMKKVLVANTTYFLSAWNAIRDPSHRTHYNASRNEAIVALTNLTDNFQQMLAEPGSSIQNSQAHQFVIASYTLIGRISALTGKDVHDSPETQLVVDHIIDALQMAGANLEEEKPVNQLTEFRSPLAPLHPLSIMFSLADDIRSITSRTS